MLLHFISTFSPLFSVVAKMYICPPSLIFSFFLRLSTVEGKFLIVMFAFAISFRNVFRSFLLKEDVSITSNLLPGKSIISSDV